MSETLSLVLESLPDLLSGARFTVLLSLGGMSFGLLLGADVPGGIPDARTAC